MGDAAAERAARANGIMGDVTHDGGEEPPKRAVHDRLVEGGVAHARADGQACRRPRRAAAAPPRR